MKSLEERTLLIMFNLLRKDIQKAGLYKIVVPSGRICEPAQGGSWRVNEQKFQEGIE